MSTELEDPAARKISSGLAELLHAAGESLGQPGTTAILMIKVNDLRKINVAYGYDFGERLLFAAEQRLQNILPAKDLVFLLDRSELAVLFTRIISPHVFKTALNKVTQTLNQPYSTGPSHLQVRFTLGISYSQSGAASAQTLLREADVALLAAQREMQAFLQYDAATMSMPSNDLDIQTHLEFALAKDELSMVYQPKVDIRSGEVIGVEALMRWNSEVLGPVSPDRFIIAAEKTGRIGPMTYWAIGRAAKQYGDWGASRVPIAVNLSAVLLSDSDLLAMVGLRLRTFGAPLEGVSLEVTETAVMDRPEFCVQVLKELHDYGIKLSIDDFGTGYSSLAYLKKLPVDELKIDKSFVQNILNDKGDQKIVSTVVNLARSFGMQVVAEGVEDAASYAFLRKIGCNIAQGYFISRPMPGEDFLPWLEKWNARVAAGVYAQV